MTRNTAYQILTKYIKNPVLLKHSLEVEAAMRSLAIRLKQDGEEWGIAGLLHDADYEKAKGHPEKHGLLLFKLEPNSIPSVIEQAITSHNFADNGIAPQALMDFALYSCDQLVGFITAVIQASKHKKLSEIATEGIMAKLTDKDFLKTVDRKPIYLCEEKLNLPLTEFVGLVFQSMTSISLHPVV